MHYIYLISIFSRIDLHVGKETGQLTQRRVRLLIFQCLPKAEVYCFNNQYGPTVPRSTVLRLARGSCRRDDQCPHVQLLEIVKLGVMNEVPVVVCWLVVVRHRHE